VRLHLSEFSKRVFLPDALSRLRRRMLARRMGISARWILGVRRGRTGQRRGDSEMPDDPVPVRLSALYPA